MGAAALCSAQSSFTPLRPPSLPLAVRSPYMSTWQQAGSDGGNGGYLPGQWPTFWAGAITGWTGYIRVDNITYIWLGDPVVLNETNYFVTQTSYEYTSTQSIFTFNVAGVVGLQATFVSPVLPDTLLEMSLPYTYLDVSVYPLDGATHDIQVYTDISAEWTSGDRSNVAEWSYGAYSGAVDAKKFPAVPSPTWPASQAPTTYATNTQYSTDAAIPTHGPSPSVASEPRSHPTGVASPPTNATKISDQPLIKNTAPGGVAYHRVWRQSQEEFTEINQQAEWGYWYYATDNTQDLTHQIGRDISVRAQFINNGFLNNSIDFNYRAIDDDYPVFSFAIDLGEVSPNANVSNLFQLSLHQQNCILFEGASGNVSVPCLWTNYFDTEQAAVAYFYNNFDDVYSQSQAIDNQVATDSIAVSGESYLSLTSLAVRQAFGGLEYTNSPTQPWIFLKEISSDGDTQTVDVIFPFHPIVVYFNSTLLRYLLDPLFINQESGYFPYAFAEHDLGVFPQATGYNNLEVSTEKQPVEECGNMLIMSLAYAQRTGDNAYLAEHYDLLDQWTQYLIADALIPGSQLSTDDFLGPLVNDTNLALKGIIGIEAMAQIANRTGHTADGVNYTNIAHNYIQQWYEFGINNDSRPEHSEAEYHQKDSYDLLYNLYGDAELGLQLVKQQVYEIQSNFYPTKFNKYGVPLRNIGSDTVDSKADWELFVAAISGKSTQTQFIDVLSEWLDQTPTNYAFTDFYNTESGGYGEDEFITRPVVGAMFSLLALKSAPSSGYYPPSNSYRK